VTVEPDALGEAREVARISAHVDSEDISLLVGRASDGGYCQIVRSDRTPTNRSCSIALPNRDEIGVSAMNFGGAPGGVLLLVGPAGSDIATLEVRYQDGRTATAHLSEHWVLYEVDPSDYVQGRRPELLVARDASGNEIASERLPWATPG